MLNKSKTEIENVYAEACKFLDTYITEETSRKIAEYNNDGEKRELFDYKTYIKKSFIRYKRILLSNLEEKSNWLEIGALFPVLPITLSMLGFKVTVLEEYSFYPEEIQEMYKIIANKYNIEFKNINFTYQDSITLDKQYKYVSLMGVIEHLPYTPKFLLTNIYNNLETEGSFFMDVPNIYYAYKIKRFILGQHIQTPIDEIYNSEIPYVGHHREYCIEDVKYILKKSNIKIERIELFNYSLDSFLYSFPHISITNLFAQIPNFRELIFVEGKKI